MPATHRLAGSKQRGLRLAAAYLFLLSLVWAAPGQAEGNTPIFVLHSYSQEYPWTKRQHEGFLRQLGAAASVTPVASVEYLDTKRVPYTAAYAEMSAGYLAKKYAGFEPKLIYVTDDNALLFALAHLTRIFPKAPIFFSGVNDLGMKQRIDPSRVTGVFEEKEIAPNLDLMRHLAPEASDILVVGDESETFQAIRHEIVAELAREPDIHAQFVSSGRIQQLVAALQGRKEKFVFLTTLGAMKDAAGRVLTLPETIAAIALAGRFVIISMEDAYLYPGVLGGYVTSGTRQGAAAAGLGARYLAGTAVAAIKPVDSPNEYLIDGSELEKLGLTLPPGLAGRTIIVNPMPTFYQRNLEFIVRALYALALLFVVSLAIFSVALLRKNQKIAQTSKNLAAQTARLDTVVDAFPLVLWAIDREGVFTLSRGAGLKVLGQASDEVVGKSLFEIYANFPAIIESVRRALAGESHMSTTRIHAVVFETQYAPLHDENGVIVGATGVSADITERKRAEDALESSEKKFKEAFYLNPDIININRIDDGRHVSVNPEFTRITGYTEDEIVGDNAIHFDIWDDPEDRARLVQGLKKDGVVSNLEARFRAKDGSIRYGLLSASAIEIDGVPHILSITRDLTERKQLELERRTSEDQMRAFYELDLVGIAITSPEKGWVRVNQCLCRMLEYSEQELRGMSWAQSTHPDDLAADVRQFDRLLANEIDGYALEKRFVSRTGKIVSTKLVMRCIRKPSGAVDYVTAMVEDITEQRRAEHALEISEDKFRKAFYLSPDSVNINRVEDGMYVSINRGFTQIIGYTEEEILGHTSVEFNIWDDPKDRIRLVEGLTKHGAVSNLEARFRTKGGGIIYGQMSAALIEIDNVPHSINITRDITKRKRAEMEMRKLSHAIEQSPSAIMITNPAGNIEYVNPRFEQLTGYTATEAIGSNPRILKSGNTPAETYRDLWGSISKGGQWRGELCNRRKNGEIFWEFAAISGVRGEGGEIRHYVAVKEDITERKKAEAERDSLEAQLRQSQKMEAIGTLAGGIAHDFNNIIATILGNTELARQDVPANPVALESLGEIRKAASRARELVQQILSFSRRQAFERKPTALAPIVEESARLLRATLPARLTLEVYCAAEVPPAPVDAVQIQQVLINLVTNAMQMIDEGKGRIGIRLDTVTLDAELAASHGELAALHAKHPGCTVRLAVSDDGPGMDAATLGRIFEPFYSTKPVGVGTGLGLSVVLGIVHAHEGAITVDSQPGKGATFSIYLPAAEAHSAAPASAEPATAASATPQLGGGQHILYIDDDESLVFLVRRLLQRRGFRISGYTDQREALDALRADPFGFDLAVADYNMPGMSGLELAREVRTIRADLPVVVASGFIDEKLRAEAPAAGVRELVFKAGTAEDLCDAFARLAHTLAPRSQPS